MQEKIIEQLKKVKNPGYLRYIYTLLLTFSEDEEKTVKM